MLQCFQINLSSDVTDCEVAFSKLTKSSENGSYVDVPKFVIDALSDSNENEMS